MTKDNSWSVSSLFIAHSIYWSSPKQEFNLDWSGEQRQMWSKLGSFLLMKYEATYSWWIFLHCHFCAKHHNWFQPVMIACHWHLQHCILKSAKGWYKAFIIIIRVFEHILLTKGLGWIQLLSLCHPKVQLPSTVISSWQLWIGARFNAFKCRLKDLMNINEEQISEFIIKKRQECLYIFTVIEGTALFMTSLCWLYSSPFLVF